MRTTKLLIPKCVQVGELLKLVKIGGLETLSHSLEVDKRVTKFKASFFLINILDLPAETVAEIYRRRWEIEVFFRFLKQEMNFTHFVCNDSNAIQVIHQ